MASCPPRHWRRRRGRGEDKVPSALCRRTRVRGCRSRTADGTSARGMPRSTPALADWPRPRPLPVDYWPPRQGPRAGHTTRITSPYDGVITKRNFFIFRGAYRRSAAEGRPTLLTVAPPRQVRCDAVPDRDVPLCRATLPRSPSHASCPVSGKVSRSPTRGRHVADHAHRDRPAQPCPVPALGCTGSPDIPPRLPQGSTPACILLVGEPRSDNAEVYVVRTAGQRILRHIGLDDAFDPDDGAPGRSDLDLTRETT